MTDGFPPIRLTGGSCLRAGRIEPAAVAIAGGRFVAGSVGPTATVDVSGHLVLPGIVDLRSAAWIAHMPPGRPRAPDVGAAVSAGAATLARNGVTTAWISAGWSRADGYATPAIAEAVVAATARLAAGSARIDARPRIEADTHLTELTDRLIALIRRGRVAHVALKPLIAVLQDIAEGRPGGRAAWARGHAVSPQAVDRAIAASAAVRAAVPRHLCRLAEECDRQKIGYSSVGDKDAEAREYYRMLGARLADAPRSRGAALAAQAMGDPVVIEARDVIDDTRHQSWVADGLVDALVTADIPSSALRAVLALEARGIMDFERGWQLVSSGPAAIMGRKDLGEIAEGRRADLVLIDATTRHVAATICGGRVTAGQGPLAERLAEAFGGRLAAE